MTSIKRIMHIYGKDAPDQEPDSKEKLNEPIRVRVNRDTIEELRYYKRRFGLLNYDSVIKKLIKAQKSEDILDSI